jgi:hypothetical protein
MASPREQRRRTERAAKYGQRILNRELGVWTGNVVAEWTPGSTAVPQESETELHVILRRAYDRISGEFLKADYRIYKQEDETDPFDEAMRAIAAILAVAFAGRVIDSSVAILGTLREMMRRASSAGMDDPDMTPEARATAARTALARRMRDHRIIIAVTESNWTVSTAHNTAVVAVTEPMRNTVERIAQLFEAGDNTGARRLARRALRLARLPSSVSQGKLLTTISDARDRLVTPGAQARIIATMRDRADALQSQQKKWHARFRNTRPTHAEAHGQIRPIDEPFTVGGHLMQYPMEGSLGAPLGEIINCECEAVYL